MRIGVLTGGGDCPGLNAVIRAVVRKGVGVYGHEFVGFRDGWRGPARGRDHDARHRPGARHPAPRRHDPRLQPDQPVQDRRRRRADQGQPRESLGIDALIAIGGEDTLGVAKKLHDEGVKVVGVPKTIDNDLGATDYTFGFDTAVNIAMEAIDRLHTTAESHHRVLIVEVMGRHAGWIALHAGMAGGANVILLPERPFDIDAVCAYVEQRFASHYAPIIVVSEGAQPVEGTMTLAVRRARRVRPRPPRRHRRPAGQGDRGPHGQGGPRRRSSATSSAVARRPRSTGCSPPASACGRSTPSRKASGAPWPRCGAPTSSRSPLDEATKELKLVPAERFEEAEVFFG